MAKSNDFSKIGNNVVSKFLSSTKDDKDKSIENNVLDGQIELKIDTHNTHDDDKTHDTHNTHNKHNTEYTHNTHKEIKSKRLNLLIQPSLLEDIKKIAYIDKISANELIIRLLKDYTEQSDQQKKIKKYDEI